MATVKLKNITSGYAKVGQLVRIDPKNPSAFQYVTDLTKLDVIGTVAQAAMPGQMCTINLINEGVTGSGNIVISPTAPVSPTIGMTWIEISQT
jgi:translation elongation factor EF-1alpha